MVGENFVSMRRDDYMDAAITMTFLISACLYFFVLKLVCESYRESPWSSRDLLSLGFSSQNPSRYFHHCCRSNERKKYYESCGFVFTTNSDICIMNLNLNL